MNTFDDSFKDLPDVPLSPEVQRQHLAYLRALPDSADLTDLGAPPSRRRRQRYIVSGISAAVILAGAGTAAAFGAFTTVVTNTNTAYCYRTANLDENSGNRMEFATQGTKQNPRDAAASGVDICAAYWRAGVFHIGKPADVDRVPTGGTFPVPPLVACVLPSGQAGIFPGESVTCRSLGLGTYLNK